MLKYLKYLSILGASCVIFDGYLNKISKLGPRIRIGLFFLDFIPGMIFKSFHLKVYIVDIKRLPHWSLTVLQIKVSPSSPKNKLHIFTLFILLKSRGTILWFSLYVRKNRKHVSPTRPNIVDFAHTPSNALISTLQNFKKEFFKNMLKPDIRPLHFPPIFFTPLPFLVQGRNTLSLNADHFAPPPIPHPSYKVRIGKGRYLRICDSLGNDTYGEILTPHFEFKPCKSCCSCFNFLPPLHI